MKETQSLHKAALEYIYSFMDKNGESFLFHNYSFIIQAQDALKEISKNESIPKEQLEIPRLVIAFKEVGIVNSDDPSLNNQAIIDNFFEEVGFSSEQTEQFNQLMDFVRGNRVPKNRIEILLRDSLNIYLAYPDTLEKLNLLRLERELLYHQTYDDLQWLEICKRYFITHDFLTSYAKQKYGGQRYKNFVELDRLLYKMRMDKQKQAKSNVLESTEDHLSFKEAEDLFKIAFRNYVDLVSVADRKAGLMLNVNSIIVSVVIAFTLRRMDTHPLFLIPTITILVAALATIYFAILASKPQEKTQHDPELHEGGVFFFGSFDRIDNDFIKIKWDQYKNSLQNLVNGNRGQVIDQITQETFIVRKILAQKFRYISIAYKIFQFGLILTIIGFVAFYLLSIGS